MKNKNYNCKKFYWSTLALALSLLPHLTLAAPGTGAGTIPNPINQTSILGLLKGVLKVVLEISIPVAALGLVFSGFLFVKARGNEQELTKAKSVFFWVIVGTAVILGAWVLTQGICQTVVKLGAQINCQ